MTFRSSINSGIINNLLLGSLSYVAVTYVLAICEGVKSMEFLKNHLQILGQN